MEHGLHLRLPLPREGLHAPSRRSRSRSPTASPTCRRPSTPASTVDDFAPRLAFFFNGHNNVFQEVAKFRAARRMWAHIMRERFGAQEREVAEAALPHADRRRDADRAAAGEQHRARRAAGLRRRLRRHAVAAHQRLRRGARAAHRARREDRAAHAADHRPRVGRGRHRRSLRRLLLRRGADGRDRAARERADREGRRARRLGQRDRLHQERDRGVGLGLPGALPQEQDIVVGVNKYVEDDARGAGPAARRPRVRARAGGPPEGVQGEPRPGARRHAPRGAAQGRARQRQPAAADPPGAARTAPRWARSAARCGTSSAEYQPDI